MISHQIVFFLALVNKASPHAIVIGAGPAGLEQPSRRPQNPRTRQVSGTDGGTYCEHCVRYVSQHMDSAKDKFDHWGQGCVDYEVEQVTVDEGYCLGGSASELNSPGPG